jgi:hypothetical protein
MVAQNSILQRCFEEAASSSARALERCVDEAILSLQAEEAGAIKVIVRDRLALAWNSLLKQRSNWPPAYAAGLRAAFRAEQAGDVVAPTPSSFAGLDSGLSGFADLTLVDDAQITQNIEFARLSQQLRLQVDALMADLDALVCAAQGLPSVQPEQNPLRPEVFAGALRDLIGDAPVEHETRARWLKALAVPLGRELHATYESLIALLNAANVQAVSYRWVAAASGGSTGGGRGQRPGGGGAPDATGAQASGGGGWGTGDSGGGGGYGSEHGGGSGGGFGGGPGGDGRFDAVPMDPLEGAAPGYSPGYAQGPAPLEVSASLYEDFLVHGVDHDTRLAESYYARIDQELAQLRAQTAAAPEGPAPSLDPQRRVDGQSPLNPEAWGAYAQSTARRLVRAELKKEATHVGQVLGLEVVRKLVNQVAQDPRLLVPVRESIVALEPSLLRLAMVDPRFFSEETHPGRRLMERVAQRSFKYEDTESSEFHSFFESVRKSFNSLNALKIDSAQPFNSALAVLEEDWNQRDSEEEARQHELLHGLRFAEERQGLADQIAYDMSSRPDLDKVPGPVLDFLYGPWALAMAHARLVDRDRQIDPRGYGLVVSDLVWSVKRDFTLRQPAKLMDMIPGMLRRINSGLDLIGQGAREREAFIDVLMRLHGPVLRLRRMKSERDAQESGAMPLEPDLMPASPEQRVPKAAAQPWLAPAVQEDAGFEDTLSSGPAELEAANAVGDHVQPAPGVPTPLPMAGTAEGHPEGHAEGHDDGPDFHDQRVEAVLDGLSTGCWVNLYSRQRWMRAQLVWASARGTLFMFISRGGRPHSMTRRSCGRLVAHQWLRPVGAHGVVAHALASLKEEAQARACAANEAQDPREPLAGPA